MKPRNYTWLDKASLLFLDQPVGSGYSYVDWTSALTKNNAEISADLITFSRSFFNAFPEFQTVPFYIFAESYGGKMATRYALDLKKAVSKGQLKSNLKGVALVDSWISPVDYVLSWAPYLYSFSLIDENSYAKIHKEALECKRLVDSGQYVSATRQWDYTERVILQNTNNINFYNVFMDDPYSAFYNARQPVPEVFADHPYLASLYERHVTTPRGPFLQSVMNGYLKTKLNIPFHVYWGSQSGSVFNAMSGDFMKPVINEVDELLTTTDVEIIVITGQLDLIVDTVGTNMWMQKLKWSGFKAFNQTTRLPISIPSDRHAGFVKSYGKLSYYYMLKAGHLVPGDAPEASYKMLDMILFNKHRP